MLTRIPSSDRRSRVARRLLLLVGLVSAGACASGEQAPFDELGRQFAYRVPFEIGKSDVTGGNRVEILEVWGTRPTIEPGGDYLVVGTSHLESAEAASVDLGFTATKFPNDRVGADLAKYPVVRGDARFTIHADLSGPGYFHVTMTTQEKGSKPERVANVYFGKGESLLAAAEPIERVGGGR